jgi:hypothetical protein
MAVWAGRIVFALALGLPFLWRLDAEEFHGDESHWISSGQRAFHLLATGRWDDEEWREEFYLYSQPQVGKLLLGAALATAGLASSGPIYDYHWQRSPLENRAAGRIPPERAILVGRIPGAIAGWLACLLIWLIAHDLGSTGAGRVGAILLASQPLWLANSRRAGLDASSLCLGLLAAWAFVHSLTSRTARPRAWAALAGVALGLAVGAKYVGLLAALAACAAVPFVVTRRTLVRGAGQAVFVVSLAVVVFILTNPTLYANPIQQLRISVEFLSFQADDMRREFPMFGSPALVAAEVVDRVIWPTGFPPVVDRTLPNALIPGTYGTPIVALGVATGLVLVIRSEGATRRCLAVGLVWSVAVFVLLTLSLPTWWERWHLPLVPPLCLLAGAGLTALGRKPRPRRPLRVPRLSTQWRGEYRNHDPAAGDSPSPPEWRGGGGVRFALAAAQYVSALAMGPSYLGKGFGALIFTPVGAVAHLAALIFTLIVLVRGRPGR